MCYPSGIVKFFFYFLFFLIFSFDGFSQNCTLSVCNDNSCGPVFVTYSPSGANVFCEGSTVELENTSSTPDFDEFYIDWGDGIIDTVYDYSNITHVYNYQNIDRCAEGPFFNQFFCYVGVKYCGSEISCNWVTGVVTVELEPVAIFDVEPVVCEGVPVNFTSLSCNESSYFWDFGDGNTSTDENPVHTYLTQGTYDVKLEVENACGTSEITQQIQVIGLAVANAQVISGVENPQGPEPFIVCSNTVFLDGSNSQNEIFYEWIVRPAGSNTSWGNSRPDSVNPPIYFNEEGDYIVILEVDNACQIPDYDTLLFEVIGTENLSLQEEPDACESIEYSPDNINSNATYFVDGTPVDPADFPVNLAPGIHDIRAVLTSLCGDQILVDTFEVFSLEIANFLMNDTILCSASGTLILPVNISGNGECYLNGQLLPDCIFDPTNALANNTIIFRDECIEPDTLNIQVVQIDELNLTIPANTFCLSESPFTITASSSGGQWFGNGFANPNSGLYDPSLAGEGLDTIEYFVGIPSSPGDTCPAMVTEVIEIFPELQVDFLVVDCNGNALSFDTTQTSVFYTSINYDFGDGGSASQVAPTHTYANPGTYTVTLTLSQNGGCSAQQTQMITVEPPPVADFSLMHSDTICSGDFLSVTNTATGTNLSYLWLLNGDTISTNSNPGTLALLAQGADSSFVLVQQVRNGCTTDIASQNIYVQAGPNPLFFTAQNTICSGDTLSFNNISANNGTFWFWDYGDGTTSNGPIPLNHFYITAVQDTFQIQLTVGNNCDTTTYVQDVIVVPTDVTAFLNIDNPVVCSGEPFRLINGSGIPGAEFYFSDGNTAFGDTVFYQFETTVDTSFSVTMRVYGCGFDEVIRTITVLAPPTLTLNADLSACNNENAQIELISNVANLFVDLGDGNTSTASNIQYLYSQPGTYTLLASATSIAGCRVELSKEIEILPIGAAGFFIENPPCEKSLLSFVDTSVGNINQWFWDFGDGNQLNGSNNINHAYENTGSFITSLITVFSNGCSDTISESITIEPNPSIDFTYSQIDSCQTEFSFLSTTSTIDFVEWNFGDGNSSSLNDPFHQYNISGPVLVQLVASRNGCLDTVIQQIEVPIIPSFALDFQYTSDACAPSSISFFGNTTNTDSVFWNFGDGIISTQENPVHTYLTSGTYNVSLEINGEECQKDTTFAILIGEPLIASVDTFVEVACFDGLTGQILVEVTSGNGNYEYEWSNQQDNNPAVGLSAGDYQLTITDALGCTTIIQQAIGQPSTMLMLNVIDDQAVSCFEGEDGVLEVAGEGGTFPYQYFWNNGDTLRRLEQIPAGNYSLTIVDQQGCEIVEEVLLTQPQPIEADFFVMEPFCFGDTNGIIEVVDITGGTPAVNFPNYEVSLDSNFSTLSYIYEDLPEGEQLFYIRDERGCIATKSVWMTEPSPWNLSVIADKGPVVLLCDTIQLEAQITATGADFMWNTGTPLAIDSLPFLNIALLESGTVFLQATIGECSKTDSISFIVDDSIQVYIPNAFTPCGPSSCDGVNDFFTAFSDYPGAKQIKTMRIVNRWGEGVFQKDNFSLSEEREGWDGRLNEEPMPPGKYTYYIVVDTAKDQLSFQGTIQLIR